MQRVIEQLSDTLDPRLFQKKVSRLLELFEKWEGNMISREHSLLSSEQQISPATSSSSYQLDKRLNSLSNEQYDLSNKLSIISAKLRDINVALRTAEDQEMSLIAKHRDLQNSLSSTAAETSNLLASQKSHEEHTRQLTQELEKEKQFVQGEWEEVIAEAELNKQSSADNAILSSRLAEITDKLAASAKLIERKYQSLHNIQSCQQTKRDIDERESKLRLKEENIRLLKRELANLKRSKINLADKENPIHLHSSNLSRGGGGGGTASQMNHLSKYVLPTSPLRKLTTRGVSTSSASIKSHPTSESSMPLAQSQFPSSSSRVSHRGEDSEREYLQMLLQKKQVLLQKYEQQIRSSKETNEDTRKSTVR